MKQILNEDLEKIGFNHVMSMTCTLSPYGNQLKKRIAVFPSSSSEKLQEEYENISVFINAVKKNQRFRPDISRILHKVKDIRNTIKKLSKTDAVLDEIEFFEIKSFIILSEDLKKTLKRYSIGINATVLPDLSGALKLLNPCEIIMGTFQIYGEYSKELSKLRKEKLRIESEMITENSEEKLSALKDERTALVIREQREELKVREELTVSMKEFCARLSESADKTGLIDLFLAKAVLAVENGCVMPEITSENKIELLDAVNPAVKENLLKKKLEFIPVSIALSLGTNVITGANMGGKSVSLATITLNVYLSLCGFYAFAKKAVVPHLDFVFFISGDMQSLSNGLSTFGAEISIVRDIMEDIKTKRGFFASDEFAKGTNPEEGRALVRSFFEYLARFVTFSLMTTHFDGVIGKEMTHYQVTGLSKTELEGISPELNLRSFGSIQKYMDYRLEKKEWNSAVPKEAIKVARLLGFEENILKRAQSILEEKIAK